MSLAPGTKLGSYEIIDAIGAGGMGEVYRARDSKLGREVAVKVLPDIFTKDQERLARFEREARLLASLNHPNIATIHGLEDSEGVRFLVMELVQGVTLSEQIARGPLPVDEAIPLFMQIAEALEAAHEKSVIHRDLKPANIKVTPEGKIKVLDFGLAKAIAPQEADVDPSQSPTLTKGTALGAIMGTAAYMSPEQARGKPVDKRTDIWAFGCCLYEALTGKSAFRGETVTDTLAAIVNKEPNWTELPETVPWRIQDVVRRCLRKDASQRLQNMGSIRVDIHDGLNELPGMPPDLHTEQKSSHWWSNRFGMSLAMAFLLGGLAAWIITRPTPDEEKETTRFTISLPQDQVLGGPSLPFAVSPDGRRITYVALEGSSRRLFVRELDEFVAQPLPGTDGASSPFFSPDGQWIGFFADESLRKVSVSGGEILTLCETPAFLRPDFGVGSVWCPDGNIIFGAWIMGLFKVSDDGGVPEALLTPEAGEFFAWPHLLPDGKNLLFCVHKQGNSQVALLSLETMEIHSPLLESVGAEQVRYLPTDHLLYVESGALRAIAFNLETLEARGAPFSLMDNLYTARQASISSVNYYSASSAGVLAFSSGPSLAGSEMLWVDRDGQATVIAREDDGLAYPRMSPDGTRVAVNLHSSEGRDIWIYDIERGTRMRLTYGPYFGEAVWTPDGKRIAFSDSANIYWTLADGSSDLEQLTFVEETVLQFASSISPDNVLALYRVPSDAPRDVWTMRLDGSDTGTPFVATEFDEHSPVFSPDGKWIAYVSDETDREEVYLRAYPGPGGKHALSTAGGREPVWSADGSGVYYRYGNKMMFVEVETDPEVSIGQPQFLFEGAFYAPAGAGISYDVSSDGQKFLMLRRQQNLPENINVVLNWFDELKQLDPTN